MRVQTLKNGFAFLNRRCLKCVLEHAKSELTVIPRCTPDMKVVRYSFLPRHNLLVVNDGKRRSIALEKIYQVLLAQVLPCFVAGLTYRQPRIVDTTGPPTESHSTLCPADLTETRRKIWWQSADHLLKPVSLRLFRLFRFGLAGVCTEVAAK
jgi:hypothetical protein